MNKGTFARSLIFRAWYKKSRNLGLSKYSVPEVFVANTHWVNEVLPWRVLWQDLGNLNFDSAREWELIETLRQRQFDAAIILTSFSQSPHPAALACYLAGIPLR